MEVQRPASTAPGPGLAGGFFTEADLAAADQLVQLSVSGGASPTSSSLSARSVNNTEVVAGREDCYDDGVLDRRARKRYRRVAELYQATRPVGAGGGKRRREEISGKP